MKRLAPIAALLLGVAALLVLHGRSSPRDEVLEGALPATPAPAAPAADGPPRLEPAPPPPVAAPPPPQPDAPLPLPDDLSPEKRAFLENHPELRERARQHLLAPEADARWEEAVARGGYTPQDLDPAVREAFGALALEPRYAEGGRIEGLVIQEMPAGHPFARAGLQRGDRIDRIQGTPLRDPAELPSLLAHLGPRLDLCALRGGLEICREVVLDALPTRP